MGDSYYFRFYNVKNIVIKVMCDYYPNFTPLELSLGGKLFAGSLLTILQNNALGNRRVSDIKD